MTETGRDDEGDGGDGGRVLSDAALAKGMRSDADDASYRIAWREFDRRHLPHVKGFIEARAHDSGADVCDDLLIEALERIQKGIDEYVDQGPGKLRSWCIKIADRVVKDLWRGRLHDLQDGPPDATGDGGGARAGQAGAEGGSPPRRDPSAAVGEGSGAARGVAEREAGAGDVGRGVGRRSAGAEYGEGGVALR